ncbi:hypothetical protein [Niveispirillum sp. SYP-B3756]|uniref:hypothetical protein n=1 Tax=Niveispirillum sp. SYP-B3756 TaxID=2662178 RepID=UPI001B3C0D39|nr:hypothetical protein [Niveispirillum sp. SYP-B3756]
MGTWTTATVADCLIPVPVTGKAKIQTRNYKRAGRFPIVDQGQNRIAGWTEDEVAVIDKLNRALMGFSRLVEVFDRNGVTFVFVPQSFNTATSRRSWRRPWQRPAPKRPT